MNQKTRTINISEMRSIVARLVNDQPVPETVKNAAQQNFRSLVQAATAHGLSEAEVVRSLLLPVFDKHRGCDCPTCRWRRVENEEAMLLRVSLAA
ncbi:MAG: hypothetical protein ACE5Q6_15520 [Dehalococcoidia bacterium]